MADGSRSFIATWASPMIEPLQSVDAFLADVAAYRGEAQDDPSYWNGDASAHRGRSVR